MQVKKTVGVYWTEVLEGLLGCRWCVRVGKRLKEERSSNVDKLGKKTRSLVFSAASDQACLQTLALALALSLSVSHQHFYLIFSNQTDQNQRRVMQ